MAVTLAQFVENLARSGLFTAEELTAFQDSLPPDRRPQKPQELARELIHAGRLTKYQAALVYQGKTKGLVLGDYVIQDEIGHGGMGQVFKAWRRDMERTVALKILPAKAMGSPDAVERFRREVKAAAKLLHPNIVTAFDAGEAEGTHFLVMEYVDGKDLAHVLMERGPLPVEEAVDYVIQAARGLECAHEQGVVHRDIKPGNLLLDCKGTVKVLDMGLARIDQPPDPYAPTAPEALTESGRVMGTYDYMAPEQAQDTHRADHRADIYSLGCTLYRLLTGQKPYQGDTPVQVLLAHSQAPVPSLRERRDDVSPELDAVVQKMLAKDPADRQQSMGEVIEELERCIRPAASAAPEPPTPPPVEQPAPSSSSSSDSALKAFLRRLSGGAVAAQAKPLTAEETGQLQREQETSVLAGRRARSPAAQRKTLMWLGIGGGILAVLLLLAVGFALFGPGGPEQGIRPEVAEREPKKEPLKALQPTTDRAETCLLIQWPEAEQQDAKLEIDGRPVDLAGAGIQSDQAHLKIPTDPGSHKIWIARRGFAPYEVQVAISEGQSLEITPEWQAAPGLVEAAEPGPEQAAMPGPEPSEVGEEPPPSEPEPVPPKPQIPEFDPEEQKRLAAEQRYREALAPAEDLVAAWIFREALVELGKLRFEEEDPAARLASRREQVEKLAQLKSRIIEALNTADPPVTKSNLKIRGVGGDIVKADEEGITAQLRTKTETRAWNDLGEQSTEPLLGLVIDPQKAEDLLAAGLLAMACKDTSLAEGYFDRASELGADIGPYLAPLARTAFTRARELLAEGQFSEADEILANVETKYVDTPWFATNRSSLAAARAQAKQGIYEAEAEKLYAEAAQLFEKERLFDVKPLVEKLKSNYANSQAVTEDARQPSFAEMEEAIAKLGQFITVRLDAKGDFSTMQQAIDAGDEPNSLIESQDTGPYDGAAVVRDEIAGVTIRGKQGCCPIVTSRRDTEVLLQVFGSGTTLERLALVHVAPRREALGVRVRAAASKLSSTLICMVNRDAHSLVIDGDSEIKNCLVLGKPNLRAGKHVLRNCIFVRGGTFSSRSDMRFCTIRGDVRTYSTASGVFLDSIVDEIVWDTGAGRHQIENCDLFGGARPDGSRNCISSNPHFVNPDKFDYRLMPTSPCIGKASDGGDIGCRYTPEMIELCEKALELRAKGIIKF